MVEKKSKIGSSLADAYVGQIIQGLSTTSKKLLEICQAQELDNVCQQLVQFCREVWPHHSKLKGNIKVYKSVAGALSVQSRPLLRGSRIVIPPAL